MSSRWSPPGKLGDILKATLEKWNLTTPFKRYEVMEEWGAIVGETTASKSRPVKLLGENLVVEVDHPAWVQELNLLKFQILKKISKNFPQAGIKNIRFILK